MTPRVPWTGRGLCECEEVCRKYLEAKKLLNFLLIAMLAEPYEQIRSEDLDSLKPAIAEGRQRKPCHSDQLYTSVGTVWPQGGLRTDAKGCWAALKEARGARSDMVGSFQLKPSM
jgi:hypothetical protein